MVVGELEYTINEQEKQIKELTETNEYIKLKNKEYILLINRLERALKELILNEIDLKELQSIYEQVNKIISNPDNANKDITKEIRTIKDNTNNNYLFLLIMWLFEDKTELNRTFNY